MRAARRFALDFAHRHAEANLRAAHLRGSATRSGSAAHTIVRLVELFDTTQLRSQAQADLMTAGVRSRLVMELDRKRGRWVIVKIIKAPTHGAGVGGPPWYRQNGALGNWRSLLAIGIALLTCATALTGLALRDRRPKARLEQASLLLGVAAVAAFVVVWAPVL